MLISTNKLQCDIAAISKVVSHVTALLRRRLSASSPHGGGPFRELEYLYGQSVGTEIKGEI